MVDPNLDLEMTLFRQVGSHFSMSIQSLYAELLSAGALQFGQGLGFARTKPYPFRNPTPYLAETTMNAYASSPTELLGTHLGYLRLNPYPLVLQTRRTYPE
jgi:hypothetical protein